MEQNPTLSDFQTRRNENDITLGRTKLLGLLLSLKKKEPPDISDNQTVSSTTNLVNSSLKIDHSKTILLKNLLKSNYSEHPSDNSSTLLKNRIKEEEEKILAEEKLRVEKKKDLKTYEFSMNPNLIETGKKKKSKKHKKKVLLNSMNSYFAQSSFQTAPKASDLPIPNFGDSDCE